MNVRGQRGQTLVELLIGMAVAGVILGALAGVLYTVGTHSAQWTRQVDEASVGDALAAALQADSHRYPPCASTSGASLTFAAPLTDASVTYHAVLASDGTSYVVERSVSASPTVTPTVTLVERLPGQPKFIVSPPTITVSVPNLGSRGDLVVYYPAPPKGYCP
jgi:prepilin-type N-terminal cleavage/methylation domain-containing protein